MDMDIPLPDELEWLEASSQFHEDYQQPTSPDPFPDFFPYPPDEDEEQQPARSPTPTPFDPQINAHKRPRPSDGPDSLNQGEYAAEKRSKPADGGPPPDLDEELLQYSPPRGEVVEEGEEELEVVVEEMEEMIISRYASVIDGDFVPVTAPSGGDRVYAKICRVEREESGFKKLAPNTRFNGKGLTSEPIDFLLEKVEKEAFNKALHASSEVQSDVVLPEMHVAHDRLWVDKYAPSSFTELLSDEQTNREVLLWLKQWDSSVFGSEIRTTSDEVLSALRRHSSAVQHQKPSDSTFLRKNIGQRLSNGSVRHSSDSDRTNNNFKGVQALLKKSKLTVPPEHKILLLCGSPGLGKTTLAHVAAKHCGYRVVEVNASDDRSTSATEAKILDVVQMNSVTADSRPMCLVIDEIDGALADGKGAVEVILKMVKSNNGKENIETGENSGKFSSKKGRKITSLLRPVICICNDLYAPALRPLRQVAKVHMFVQPTVTRVVNRLKYICNKEAMKVSSIALTALADYTECDIRSCLNTLQFLNKKKETLNALDVGTQVVGQKDMSHSAFDIWKEIFQKRKVKSGRKLESSSSSSMSNEFDFLLSLVSNRGDYDVILDGIHENILQIKYHDPVMQKTVKCFNSLGDSDLMHQHIMRTQQMSLLAYQPLLPIKIHQLVAQVQKPNIEWPKSYQRCRTTLMEKMDTLQSWQNQMPPCISRHLSSKSFVEDSITPLLHVLSPSTLRPVALHLLSENKKNDFARLVSIMVSYSITYKSTKPDHLALVSEHEAALDASALSFDPPLHEFISFKGYISDHHVLPLAMKQVLVHEVEKQKILRVSKSVNLTDGLHKENFIMPKGENCKAESAKSHHAATFASNSENGKHTPIPRPCNPCSTVSTVDSSRSAVSTVKQTGNAKKPSCASTNFFDRFRKASVQVSESAENAAQKATLLERDSRPVLFKFNEGFTNAIKRPVRMREFLL